VTEPSHAVFLSYASQDAQAAQRIADALRVAGVEVWLDQNELRGGDVWDQKIRRRIRECAIFIPIISASSQARLEGYFRLEWRLADQRTHLMAKSRAFLLPVCIDDTLESAAEVPESFLAVQWLRLPAGSSLAELTDRLSALMAGDPSAGSQSQSRLAASSQSARSGTDTPLQVHQKTIAVLPFQDLSEKKDQEYFADGIAEEILNLMGRVPVLRVIGRTSSFRFRGKSDDLRSIGTQLGAGFVVEGSVRQSGSRVRISARLIDTADGVQRWSNSYERDISDVLTVQEEIAVNLVSALQVEVAPEVITNLRAPPASTEAYDAFRRGLHAAYRSDQAGLQQAVGYFRRALELDPSFVQPAEALAATFDLLTELQILPPSQGFEEARAAANLALRLDPNSAGGHLWLGNIHTYYDWDRAAAAREINTALQLAPNNVFVLMVAGKERLVVGDWTESLRLLNLAISIDPFLPTVFVMRGVVFQRINRTSDAKKDFRRTLEISPAFPRIHSRIADVLLAEGNPEAALAELQREAPAFSLKGLALVNHALKRHGESDAALARLVSERASIAPMSIAEVYAFRGQIDEAFEWLERAIAQKEITTGYIKGDPLLSPLVADPRYARCLRKMNLTE
jgi:TolB-like protein/tetratricopeptide (TPR) repeat protein